MSTALGVDVDEITYDHVERFWERSTERLWNSSYRTWISPNKLLRAYTNEEVREIALIWNRYSGEVLRLEPKALYDLVKDLGGWI